MSESKHPIENVWDYPRPPDIKENNLRLQIIFNGATVADTVEGYRIMETSHPPTYYIPRKDIQMEYLVPSMGTTYCEWKGEAGYFDVKVKDKIAPRSAWYYSSPTKKYQHIKDHVCFYASKMDECYVDGEKVKPQEGDFYGGWITSWITGGKKGFKGGPGTWGW